MGKQLNFRNFISAMMDREKNDWKTLAFQNILSAYSLCRLFTKPLFLLFFTILPPLLMGYPLHPFWKISFTYSCSPLNYLISPVTFLSKISPKTKDYINKVNIVLGEKFCYIMLTNFLYLSNDNKCRQALKIETTLLYPVLAISKVMGYCCLVHWDKGLLRLR